MVQRKLPTDLAIPMEFERSTKGTHVYKATVNGAAAKTIYLQKESIIGEPPPALTVTISFEPTK